jgi:hypothetical protein
VLAPQIMAMSRGCFTSYMLVWDPGDFTTYRPVQERFTWRDFVVMSPFLDSPALQLEVTLWVYVSLARGVNGG